MLKSVRFSFLTWFFVAVAGLQSPALADTAKTGPLVEAYNKTGIELFSELAAKPGNVLLSPYSIGSLMAMAAAGAKGKTEAEMVKVLHYPSTPADAAARNGALTESITKAGIGKDAPVVIANALHLTQFGDRVRETYKTLLTEKFDAGIVTGSDLAAINAWVKDKTSGKIDSILSRLDPYSVCVLLNAVHFKGRWVTPFSEKKTGPGAFKLAADASVKVPMMRATGRFRTAASDAFDSIALPYDGGKLAMLVLLPKDAAADGKLHDGLSAKAVDGLLKDLAKAEPEPVYLTLPKFKTASDADLIPLFSGLGLKQPFDRDKADFGGIADLSEEKNRIHITQIRHKAFLEVEEKGTEAGAATAAEFGGRSIRPKIAEFTVNRPFLYLVVEEDTGAILFLGRISDPRS